MEEKKCEVHTTVLKKAEVPVSYGLPYFDEELIEARKKLFPNSKKSVLGGCVVGSMGRFTEELVCEECREAETAWNEANRPSKNQRVGKIRL